MIEKDEVTTPGKGSSSNENESVDDQISGDETVEMVEKELEELNTHLDRLGSALDSLERKNDDIHAQLVELLEANRQVKLLFQADSPSSENKESK